MCACLQIERGLLRTQSRALGERGAEDTWGPKAPTTELPAELRTALPTYPRKMRTNLLAGPIGIGQGVMV